MSDGSNEGGIIISPLIKKNIVFKNLAESILIIDKVIHEFANEEEFEYMKQHLLKENLYNCGKKKFFLKLYIDKTIHGREE